jgi:hypothetical protein
MFRLSGIPKRWVGLVTLSISLGSLPIVNSLLGQSLSQSHNVINLVLLCACFTISLLAMRGASKL